MTEPEPIPGPPAEGNSAARPASPAQTEAGPLDARRRRALFRATHRGTQEADRLIGGYVAPRIAAMTEAELDALERIMELPDPDLTDWLYGRRAVPAERDSPLLRAMLRAAAR